MFSVVTICYFVLVHNGMAVLDEFNDAGTMGALGFSALTFLITLAAPSFLKKRGELKAKDVALVRCRDGADVDSHGGHRLSRAAAAGQRISRMFSAPIFSSVTPA